MNEKVISVILVDDHKILLDGISSILVEDSGFIIKAALSSSTEAIGFLKSNSADILLTDYSLPGMTGMELIKQVSLGHPFMKCVILTMNDEESLVKSILKEKIDGYILKNIDKGEFKAALRQIAGGHTYISTEITKYLLDGFQIRQKTVSVLTEREFEVLKLIGKEFNNKKIADTLFISERTVETHRKNIFRKTGTTSVVGLIHYAYKHKLL